MRTLGLFLGACGFFAAGFLWGGGFERDRQEQKVLALQSQLSDCRDDSTYYEIVFPDTLFYPGIIR